MKTMIPHSHLLVAAAVLFLPLLLMGCGRSRYETLTGTWQGEVAQTPVVVEFAPGDGRLSINGRSGRMHLVEEQDNMLRLALASPEGDPGEALIIFEDEDTILMQRPDRQESAPLALRRVVPAG